MPNERIQVQAEVAALPRLPNESRSSLKQAIEESNVQTTTDPSAGMTRMNKIR
jgi:hypothetical protein